VTVTLTEEGAGTKGTVVTDLTVTGKPAQFGRGMIVEVGGKILDTFASCLASKLDTTGAAQEPPAAATNATPAAAPKAEDDEAEEPPPPAQPKPATRRRTSAKATTSPTVSADVTDVTDGAVAPEVPQSSSLDADVSAPHLQLVDQQDEPKPAPKREVNVSSDAEAIDLLDYAGPSVVKRAVPLAAGLLVMIVIIRMILRRR
jgi:uncharacterized protein